MIVGKSPPRSSLSPGPNCAGVVSTISKDASWLITGALAAQRVSMAIVLLLSFVRYAFGSAMPGFTRQHGLRLPTRPWRLLHGRRLERVSLHCGSRGHNRRG